MVISMSYGEVLKVGGVSKYTQELPNQKSSKRDTIYTHINIKSMNESTASLNNLKFGGKMEKKWDEVKENYLAEGYIKGISLPSLLTLLSYDSKTCKIVVQDTTSKGKLYFKNGKLIDAETEDETGEEAVYRLLSLSSPEIFLEPFDGNRERNIYKTIEQLLLESAKRIDESKKIKNDEKEGKMPKIEELQKLQNSMAEELPHFKACAVVSVEDGLLLAGTAADSSYDIGVPAGAFADALKSVVIAYEYSKWGKVNEFLFSGPDTIVLLISLKDGKFYQVIAVGSKTTLGMVRTLYSKYKDKIESLL